MSAMDGSEGHFCKFLKEDLREVLEAVGRKDFPRAVLVPGRAAGGDNGCGSAANASRLAAVPFPLALAAPHTLLRVAPHDIHPS